jgi:glutamate N-acetyltransferase/amino-acid N-acetyltransferase
MDMTIIRIPKGFRAAGVMCGIKKSGGKDLALIVSDVPCVAAGFFTQNAFAAAPVQLCRTHLKNHEARAIIANSGCANACTGKNGMADALKTARLVARAVGCRVEEVLVASTGVIGPYLPMEKIGAGVNRAAQELRATGFHDAAEAIITTDTKIKTASLDLEVGGRTITFFGMAKGAGMINPQMATMLAFVLTDAVVSAPALRKAGRYALERSFNCVTVDGDTSTNDTLLFLANGCAANTRITPVGKDYKIFESALTDLCQSLARQIADDGEGATRLVKVSVTGARSEKDARKVAQAVATSNLVKTAIFGHDANWGRIVCAIGNSGASFDPEKITVHMGAELLFAKGAPQVKSEDGLRRVMENHEVPILIDLKSGNKCATVWTCDLSYDYIKINADYRT